MRRTEAKVEMIHPVIHCYMTPLYNSNINQNYVTLLSNSVLQYCFLLYIIYYAICYVSNLLCIKGALYETVLNNSPILLDKSVI